MVAQQAEADQLQAEVEARQRAQGEAARVRQQQILEQQQREEAARFAAAWETLWTTATIWAKRLALLALGIWLFMKREQIARWYYFLTPHPAEGMVVRAIRAGAEVDGKAFAEIMRPMPGGRIEKEVRAEQARNLAERAERHASVIRAEAERIMAAARRDAEFLGAQDELARATMAHERAKARLDALRRRVG